MLREGDIISIYFSDETLRKFIGESHRALYPVTHLHIVYEDDHVTLIDKPVGMLSQKAKDTDVTLVEYFLGYMQSTRQWRPEDTYTPAICNRLDRNTSGLVIAGKSLLGIQEMSRLLKERQIDKYYLTIVEGEVRDPSYIRGYLVKNEKENKVTITDHAIEGSVYVETYYEPVRTDGSCTLLRIKLITGKTHQIRASLAAVGHPLICDVKYGGRKIAGQRHFFLHAYQVHFPVMEGELSQLSDKTFSAPLPAEFEKMVQFFN